jgi:hypothetical protein
LYGCKVRDSLRCGRLAFKARKSNGNLAQLKYRPVYSGLITLLQVLQTALYFMVNLRVIHMAIIARAR